MKKMYKLGQVAAAIALCIGVASCGGGGGGSGAPAASSGGSISGAAAKGIVRNGIVTLRDAGGAALQTTVSPVRTGDDGSYTATLSNSNYAGPVFVEISADGMTTIQNEVTGVFESASGLSGALLKSVGNVTAGQPVSINATPFTSIVADLVERSRGSGSASTLLVQQAQAVIATTLGFNPVSTPPIDPRNPDSATASDAEKKQAILLAALAQLGTDAGNTTCSSETTTAAKLICAAGQLTDAFAGSTLADDSADIVIDGSLLQGFSAAIAAVSSDTTINQTGATVDPATDPATNEIATAEDNMGPTTTTVQAPPEGFNETDVAAVKTLFSNLRSNAAALGNDELNGPVETQLANFADSITNQATGLETGPYEVTEATAFAIGLWDVHQETASDNPNAERLVFGSNGNASCAVLSEVFRNQAGVVTDFTVANNVQANNSAFVACVVFGEGAERPGGNGFLELRNYVLLTPTSTSNTFRVESDSRFCDIDFNSPSGDPCLGLEPGSRVIGGVGGDNAATASGSGIFDSMGVLTGVRGSFDGQVAPPIEFDFSNPSAPSAVELTDTTNVVINFTQTTPSQNTFRFSGDAAFTSTTGSQTITTALSSFVLDTTVDPDTGETSNTLTATGRVETQLGALRGSFTGGDSGSEGIQFSGAVDLKEGTTVSTLFEGAATLTAAPATETTPAVVAAALFEGTLRLPSRPELVVELQVTNAIANQAGDDLASGTLAFTYQQNGTTVIVNASRNPEGVESVTINSPTSMVTVGPFDPNTTQPVNVLRDGRVAATYNIADARVNYVDGSFEQF